MRWDPVGTEGQSATLIHQFALLAVGPSQLPVLALCPALLHGGPWSLAESMRHPLPSTADPWHAALPTLTMFCWQRR